MKTLILDFDGTIADTRTSIIKTIQATLQELGCAHVNEDEIQKKIGLPLKDTFVDVAHLEHDILEKAIKLYRQKYNDICFECVSLFPNVKDVLSQLHKRGVTIAVASSKGKEALLTLLKHLDIHDYVTMALGEQDVKNKKPAPDMVLTIIERTGALPSETLVVGDTVYDIAMGQAGNCLTAGVTYGNNTRFELEEQGPNYILNDFSELLNIVWKE